MRILHVIQSLDPAHGGPPEVAACLAAAQAASGHEVTIASIPTPADAKLTSDVPHFARVKRENLRSPRGPARGLFDRTLPGELTALIARHDVAHLHNVWDTVLPSVALAARRSGVPYVLTPHGMLDPWSLSQRPLRKKIAMATTHRALLRGAAVFHCLNAYEAQTVQALRFGPPTAVVANGVWLERTDIARPGTFRQAHPKLGDAPFLLFLGRLHHKKGLDHLRASFERVAREDALVQLVIAGPDGGELTPTQAWLGTLDNAIRTRVHLVGPIYGVEKFSALIDAACFCLPSRQEGFPIAVLEALSSRAPVVISHECRFDEVEAAGAGFVVPLNAADIAAAILRVLRDGDARSKLGGAGRRLVETQYTWPRVAEAAVEMYAAAKTTAGRR